MFVQNVIKLSAAVHEL